MALTVEEVEAVLRLKDEFSGKLGTANKSLGMFSGFVSNAVGSLAGFLGANAIMSGVSSAFSFVKDAAFGMNATLETTELQFATLMGDADQAKDHVANLFEFAKKTPFETGPIIQASRMMRTFGGDALDTKENLELIGDASAATSAPIDQLGFWIGRMYAALQGGQPFGEAAMRMQEMAVLTPQARQKMEDLQDSGAGASEIFKVFQEQLGKFSGGMVKQAATWSGVTSTFSDTVKLLSANAMKPLFETLRDLLGKVNEVFGSDKFAAKAEAFSKVIALGLNVAVKTLVGLFENVASVTGTASKVWDEFAGVAVSLKKIWESLVKGLKALYTNSGGVSEIWENLESVGEALWSIIGGIIDVVSWLNEKFHILEILGGTLGYVLRGVFEVIGFLGDAIKWLVDKIRLGVEWIAEWISKLDGVREAAAAVTGFFGKMADKLTGGSKESAKQIDNLSDSVGDVKKKTDEAEPSFKDLKEQIDLQADAASGAVGPTTDLGTAQGGTTTMSKKLKDAVKGLVDELGGGKLRDEVSALTGAVTALGGPSELTSRQMRAIVEQAEELILKGATLSPVLSNLHAQWVLQHGGVTDLIAPVTELDGLLKATGVSSIELSDRQLVLSASFAEFRGKIDQSLEGINNMLGATGVLKPEFDVLGERAEAAGFTTSSAFTTAARDAKQLYEDMTASGRFSSIELQAAWNDYQIKAREVMLEQGKDWQVLWLDIKNAVGGPNGALASIISNWRDWRETTLGIMGGWADRAEGVIGKKIGKIFGTTGMGGLLGGIMSGGVSAAFDALLPLAVEGLAKLGGVVWDGLKSLGRAVKNFIGGLFPTSTGPGSPTNPIDIPVPEDGQDPQEYVDDLIDAGLDPEDIVGLIDTSNWTEDDWAAFVGSGELPEFQHGGEMSDTGLALLHRGETVNPPGAPAVDMRAILREIQGMRADWRSMPDHLKFAMALAR